MEIENEHEVVNEFAERMKDIAVTTEMVTDAILSFQHEISSTLLKYHSTSWVSDERRFVIVDGEWLEDERMDWEWMKQ